MRQHTGERLSVLDEVLRAQASFHWSRRAGLAALLLFAVYAAVLWPGLPGHPPRAAGLPGRALPWGAPTGAVAGYIQPCQGRLVPLHTSTGARLFSAAATVEALPGQQHLKPAGRGVYRVVLPAVVAARDRVAQNQEFRLAYLAPGRYVILARYAGGSVSTSLDVSVVPGRVAEVDLPDTCK